MALHPVLAAAEMVLIDIDNTLTIACPEAVAAAAVVHGNPVLTLIGELIVEHHGGDLAAALQRIRTYMDDVVWWDYPDYLTEYDLPAALVWPRLIELHRRWLRPLPGGRALVAAVHDRGIPLAVVSNNPLVGCLLKLEVCGLATRHGSPWFDHLCASNNCRGQKNGRGMWQRCLAQLDRDPARVVMIGDDPHQDGMLPRSLGLGSTVCVVPGLPAGARQPAHGLLVAGLPELLAYGCS